MPDELVRLRFKRSGPPPSHRAVRVPFEKVEETLRRLDWYDFQCATQDGPTYTLFFKLKPDHAGEHVFKESPNAP
jgi:hypothetical protein